MIKKLRRQFILINMLSVTSILLALFIFLFAAYYRNVRRDTALFMQSVLQRAVKNEKRNPYRVEQPNHTGQARRPGPGPSMPCAVYAIGPDGTASLLESQLLEIYEEVLQDLSQKIRARIDEKSTEASGESLTKGGSGNYEAQPDSTAFSPGAEQYINDYISSYGLRYLAAPSKDGGFYVVFADVSYSYSRAVRFLLTCILIFLLAGFLFFLLSFWLSGWALAPVQKAWEQQNRFVADASHELKTPITVILANLGILSAHPDDTVRKQERWISNTKEEAERMRLLVEDLLFLAKSDAGALPAIFQEVDLSNCAEDRALNFEAVAFEKEVALDSEVQPDLSIRGNEGQLKQLLTILLDNAVKYAGPGGSVTLTAAKKQDKIELKIRNTGESIAPEDLPHIFERFYRSDKSRSRKEGGYGLGLSIAENIVRLHKGTIRCTSSPEEGTTFTVELPASAEKNT